MATVTDQAQALGLGGSRAAETSSDHELIAGVRDGNEDAFQEIVRRYRNPITNFVYRMLDDYDRSVELAQETFVVILRGSEKYEPRARFRTYMYAIAVKQLWTERRKELRVESFAASSAAAKENANPADPTTILWIRDALEQLDADHREVLMLREYEQLSYDEIAEALALPLNTVRSRLSRARAELKTLLETEPVKGVSK